MAVLAATTGTRPEETQCRAVPDPEPRELLACSLAPFPTARRAHQLFPAAVPIAGRPSAPNINDTQERGLEAQARGPTPTPAAPANSTLDLSILRSTSGSRLEAETGNRKRPFAHLHLQDPSRQQLELPGKRGESAEIGSHLYKSDFSVQLLETETE